MAVEILQGDCRELLKTLPAESVHCCVTSPPYFGLRDYGTAEWEGGDSECGHQRAFRPRSERPNPSGSGIGRGGAYADQQEIGSSVFKSSCPCGARRIDRQIGLEQSPQEYVQNLVEIFREVRRVLRKDGTCWLNLGDSYAANRSYQVTPTKWAALDFGTSNAAEVPDGLKPKDLVGIPWSVAFALRDDGWWLRSEIIWHKPAPMPESVTDRPTKAHEQIFLLAKSKDYYYYADAIREPLAGPLHTPGNIAELGEVQRNDFGTDRMAAVWGNPAGRNKRSVWTIGPEPFSEAHFAVYPQKLIEPCILAGCPVGGTVLDPFAGSGTTLRVAVKHRRNAIGIELNPSYVSLIEKRLSVDVTLPLEDAP